MVSQKQIAERLKLSRSLVSKVLNGNLGTTKVKPDTARAILDLAQKLGYRPNPTAVSLATGRQGTIGVVIRRFGTRGSRLPDMLTDGISEEARLTGQKLVLTYYADETESRCFEFLADSERIDGLLFAGSMPSRITDVLPNHPHFPIVSVCSALQVSNINRVDIDNQYIGRIATTHLIERGCRHIALIESWEVRSEGFYQAMKQAGMPIDENLIYHHHHHGFSHLVGAAAVEHFVMCGAKFDGIVGQSDEQAVGAINELVRRGIRVPEDVRVIGVDNSPFCEFATCPLTSVDQNLFEAGRIGLRLLVEQIAQPHTSPQEVIIRPMLIPRRSTE